MAADADQLVLLSAAWVAPMDGPVIRDGAVVLGGGLIRGVGPEREMRRKFPQARVEEMGSAVILPGLVNAHVHLELSDRQAGERPGDFGEWLFKLVRQAPTAVAEAVESGVAQCLRFGVTTVGDISKLCMLSRPVLREGPLRVVSYGEIQAMAQRRVLLDERFAAATDLTQESRYLTVGVTPHAPYTVEPEGYRKSLAFAKKHGRPIATHLAEASEEAEFLSAQTGSFRRLWEEAVKAWDDRVPRFLGGSIRFAAALGLIDHPTLLAHVNYCDDEEMEILVRGRASVVYCPRTHVYFGHGPHRWREMRGRGINVAVGTDSCASSPDLNVVEDLRLLHRMAPEVPAGELWEMVTVRGARALGLEREVGVIGVGMRGDLVVFGVEGDDPLGEVLERECLPSGLWIEGRKYP